MDQILHRKLINEKTNLEFQVAKANKEVAKLMETVKQYEAVLASLNEADTEHPDIPNKMRLRGDTNKDTKPNLPQQSNKPAAAPYKRNTNSKPIDEALVRGVQAIKLQAEKSGNKLPTAKEAAEQTKKIQAEKELEQAGLGKLKKSRLDEVLDTMLDKKAAANVAKHSLKQVQDEKKMLDRMPGVTPARMTLLQQQAKNRQSILKRLGESKNGKEIGEYGSAKERADNANLARLQRKSGIDLGIRGTHREAGSYGGVTPAGEAAEQRRMAQQQKTIEKFN